MEDKDLDKKLNELDERLDVASIRKYYKARLIKRINKGEVGLLLELEQLEKIEQAGKSGDSAESVHGKSGTLPETGTVPNLRPAARNSGDSPSVPFSADPPIAPP